MLRIFLAVAITFSLMFSLSPTTGNANSLSSPWNMAMSCSDDCAATYSENNIRCRRFDSYSDEWKACVEANATRLRACQLRCTSFCRGITDLNHSSRCRSAVCRSGCQIVTCTYEFVLLFFSEVMLLSLSASLEITSGFVQLYWVSFKQQSPILTHVMVW